MIFSVLGSNLSFCLFLSFGTLKEKIEEMHASIRCIVVTIDIMRIAIPDIMRARKLDAVCNLVFLLQLHSVVMRDIVGFIVD